MRSNPFYDAWMFLTGRTDEHAASGIGWLLTGLFIALLLASIWIARKNWQQDPAQRTMGHLATWFMRVMIGAMWFQGSIWKLPLPVSGGFRAAIAPIGEYAAFEVHRWIAKNIFMSVLPVLGPLVYLTELSLAVTFILGFLVRPPQISCHWFRGRKVSLRQFVLATAAQRRSNTPRTAVNAVFQRGGRGGLSRGSPSGCHRVTGARSISSLRRCW